MAEAAESAKDLRYKRAQFKARLPRNRRYSPSHFWLQEQAPGTWRIGYTKFAIRMLGEPVEIDFEFKPDAPVELGEVVGWMEGFKAVSDLFAPMQGHFKRPNPDLAQAIESIKTDPYRRGWLFELEGQPGEDCFDAEGYAKFLDGTIDRMMGTDG